MKWPQFSLLKFIIVANLLGMGVAVYFSIANVAVKVGLAASLWNSEFPTTCIWFIGCTVIGAYFNRLLTWMVLGFFVGLICASTNLMTTAVNL